jgi:hypothetical protein
MYLPLLPELAELEQIIDEAGDMLEVRQLCRVSTSDTTFPVYALALGSQAADAPAVGFFGGVHGLESIGTHILLVYLRSLVHRLKWDQILQHELQSVRLIFMPLVNPGGMYRHSRANPQGVDLMRNAPVDSREKVPFLLAGQRYSATLPWYRGPLGAPMQMESQALCDLVASELLSRPFSLALDCHSGFGLQDRLWFPYASSRAPMPHLAEMHALISLFGQTYPHHHYQIEPQCLQYLTHGDLWDHLYLQSLQQEQRLFLPLTLEMGSWMWVKKNPRQLLSRLGLFNPIVPHRKQRVLRRHLMWLEFLSRAACNWRHWLPHHFSREQHQQAALVRWFSKEQA